MGNGYRFTPKSDPNLLFILVYYVTLNRGENNVIFEACAATYKIMERVLVLLLLRQRYQAAGFHLHLPRILHTSSVY